LQREKAGQSLLPGRLCRVYGKYSFTTSYQQQQEGLTFKKMPPQRNHFTEGLLNAVYKH
jgi:hypothetical protein